MQSFKYPLPAAPPPTPSSPRPPVGRWLGTVAVVAALGAGGWWVSGLLGQVASHLFSAPDPAAPARAARAKLAAGEKALAAGRYREAAVAFAAALAETPENRLAWRRLTRAHYLALDAKLPALEAVLPAPEARTRFWVAEGEDELDQRHPAAALAAFERALAIAPRDARAVSGQARALAAAHRGEEAFAAFAQARALAPEDMTIAAALIAALYEAGRPDDARAATEAAFVPRLGRGDDPVVQVGVLEAWVRQGLETQALRARHAQAAPQLTAARRERYLAEALGRHYAANPNWNQGSYALALAAARAAAQAPAERAAAERAEALVHAARARRDFERGDFAAALKATELALAHATALRADPRALAELYAQRGRVLAVIGKPAQLQQAYEAALELEPDLEVRAELIKSYANLGVSLMGVRKAVDALPPLGRALALAPDDPALYARYYQALLRARRPDPLALVAEAAGHRDAAFARWMTVRGLLSLEERTAAGRLANDPAAAGSAAQAEWWLARGEEARAKDALTRALAGAPASSAAWRALAEVACTLARADAAHKHSHFATALGAFSHVLAHDDTPALLTRLREVHRAAAEAALEARQGPAAIQAAARGLMLAPHDPWCALALGTALAEARRYGEAEAALKAGLEGLDAADHPAHPQLRDQLGQVFAHQGRHAEAAAEFKAGLAQDVKAPPHHCANLYYGLAFALAEAGAREEALSATRQYVFWSLHDPLQAERASRVQALEQRLARP